METDEATLPLLPELLAGLDALGSDPDEVVAALDRLGAAAGWRALDLGCGKGAASLALAERLGCEVLGIDAFPPFLDSARLAAIRRGVASRCRFERGDIRERLAREADYDVVLLLAVGPLLGDHAATLAGLRRQVRSGGLIVIEDCVLLDAHSAPAGYEGYAGHAETRSRLERHGDRIVHERLLSPEETAAVNAHCNERIRAAAAGLKARRPDTASLVDAYLASQERECRALERDLIGTLWVLRRA